MTAFDDKIRDFGDIVTPPAGSDLRLRQGVVQAVTGTTTVTVRLGGSTKDIPGVPCLGYAPINGETVWVAQDGPTLIVIGSLSGRKPMARLANSTQMTLAPSGVLTGSATFDLPVTFGYTLIGGAGGSRLQVDISGWHRVSARIQRQGNNNGEYALHVRKNAAGNSAAGVEVLYAYENNASAITAGFGRNAQADDLISLGAGEYLELWAAQTSGAAVPVDVILSAEFVSR